MEVFSGIGRGKLMNSLNEELNKISDFFRNSYSDKLHHTNMRFI